MQSLIARPVRVSTLEPAAIAQPHRHSFRALLPPLKIEPLTEERWTDFTFFCASFVSGFVFFFGMIV